MNRTSPTRARPAVAAARPLRRRGLAPLELVLALPILLFVTALIVGIGAAACWKVRAQQVARNVGMRERWGRGYEPFGFASIEEWWPEQAHASLADVDTLPQLDLPGLRQPVMRGPLGPIDVRPRFDPAPHAREGRAQLRRSPPLLSSLTTYEYDVRNAHLERTWQYRYMGMSSSVARRIPVIYDLPDGSGEAAYNRAVNDMLSSPQRGAWAVLDRDDELAAWYGRYINLYPYLSGFCSLDVDAVRRDQVQPLIYRIQGKHPPRRVTGTPQRIAQTFLARFQAELNAMQQPDAIPNPARESQLEAWIAELEAFLPTADDAAL